MSSYSWSSAELCEDRLIFQEDDGLQRAIRDGFFFVEKPRDLDLEVGDRFATSFYRSKDGTVDDPYRGYERWSEALLGKRQGYATRPADQVEQFFLEEPNWEQVFPADLLTLVLKLKRFGIDVLRAVLREVGIPESEWGEATGHATDGRGTYTMAFNHYRPSVRSRGLNIHKDSGWVTILRAIKPGLEVRRDQQWVPVIPRSDAFIVNFGCTMEILTRDLPYPVAAVEHRVSEQRPDGTSPDRFSYGMFVDNSLDPAVSNSVFRYDTESGLVRTGNFQDFLDTLIDNAYGAETQGLY